MVVLQDVEAGSRWFQDVVGMTSGHGGKEYEMLMGGDTVLMQLHEWDMHEHPHLGNVEDSSRGNGVLLWFGVDDFDDVVERVEAHGVVVLDGPLDNPLAHHREIWLQGPEGYTVVVAG
jgi:catechol 2,3-dioxygenase-like lactoylglutathione lyase family enzyme